MSDSIIEHIKSIPLIKNSNNLCLITNDALLAKSFPNKFVWLVSQRKTKCSRQNNLTDLFDEESP